MTFTLTRLVGIALSCVASMAPCQADSLAASSASSAGSASSGSLSTSIGGSSNSSSPETKVANGDYRIIEIVRVAERPRMLRLKLQATAPQGAHGEFFLDLPQHTFAQSGLTRHDIVSVRHRPYGLEFARADTRDAFFLVLLDEWRDELEPRAVTL